MEPIPVSCLLHPVRQFFNFGQPGSENRSKRLVLVLCECKMRAPKSQNMMTSKSADVLSVLSRKFFPPALVALLLAGQAAFAAGTASPRERISLDAGWRFIKADAPDTGTDLTRAVIARLDLATGNSFTTNAPAPLPDGNPGGAISFAQPGFDDSQWRLLNLPHDWGIEGPFQQALSGATGKLPWFGVGWYRKHLDIPAADAGKKIYLDVDGAMSYAAVWLNGKFVGGWPYGYSSWQVDLTPYVNFGGDNVIAIRLDNPPDSSRWYPGGGIYRNVWLVKTAPVHVAHWGTYVTTPDVSATSATVKIQVTVDNDADAAAAVTVKNEIFELTQTDRSKRTVPALCRRCHNHDGAVTELSAGTKRARSAATN